MALAIVGFVYHLSAELSISYGVHKSFGFQRGIGGILLQLTIVLIIAGNDGYRFEFEKLNVHIVGCSTKDLKSPLLS
jgi:hypothetical protein